MNTQYPSTKAWLLIIALLCCFPHCPDRLHAGTGDGVDQQIERGGYALADKGRITATKNGATPFVPASTLKIITALAALDILGSDYHFATRFFQDQDKNLYIQGSGDPFLLTENIMAIAQNLAGSGLSQINNLVLDDHLYQLDGQADGNENSRNPYDAWNSSLAVNFNSIAVAVSPERVITADDPKEPLLPIMAEIGADLPAGHHRVNVNAFPVLGPLSNSQRYSGELFTEILKRQKISISGQIQTGPPPADARLVYTYWSQKSVQEMLQQCLKYSNNFVANQLFLACGAARFGAPATWDKARQTLHEYIANTLGLAESELTIVEGSGLSRQNRITPRAMIAVLQKFSPHKDLLSHKRGVLLKSGTLSGVYCYAGYLPPGNDTAFAILLNQPGNNRDTILRDLIASSEISDPLPTGKKQKNNAFTAKIE